VSNTSALLRRGPRNRPRDIMEIAMSGAKHPVDRERGLIRNVKILGNRSRNGGAYSANAMATAKPLYEGVRVNIDHPDRSTPDQERTFGDWFGVLKNVRLAKDGLYGDLSYLKSHPLAGQVCEAAERFPDSFGLSHNAQVTEAAHEGQTVYEAIHRVRSVDIVCKPATTRGIFEAETPAMRSAIEDDDAAGDLEANGALGAADGAPIDRSDEEPDDGPNDRDAFVGQMGDIFDSQDAPMARLHAGVELLFAAIGGDPTLLDDPADASAAPVEEESQTDRADRGRAAGVAVESLRPSRPRCHGGNALEATITKLNEQRASDWDDPKTATLRLLGH
jgi:hypothetical protein